MGREELETSIDNYCSKKEGKMGGRSQGKCSEEVYLGWEIL